jgi:hypothetical protein
MILRNENIHSRRTIIKNNEEQSREKTTERERERGRKRGVLRNLSFPAKSFNFGAHHSSRSIGVLLLLLEIQALCAPSIITLLGQCVEGEEERATTEREEERKRRKREEWESTLESRFSALFPSALDISPKNTLLNDSLTRNGRVSYLWRRLRRKRVGKNKGRNWF